MAVERGKNTSGYGKPPWIFKGSALYQLHLVKSETARAFIPKEFRLVEAFGYTLGGFFLASYDESPAGAFDELVVIAGIVWNPPTSCAWAARVLVNSDEACRHGRKDVGLPSQVARFSKRVSPIPNQPSKFRSFLKKIGVNSNYEAQMHNMGVEVAEITGPSLTDICTINLSPTVVDSKRKKWMGPAISISLPSFSGRTIHNPNLLKYSCKIECRVQSVKPAKVSRPTRERMSVTEQSSDRQIENKANEENKVRDLCVSVMLSKPILALEFNCLKMQVEAPTIIDNITSAKGS